jgi:hypothetical protein
MACRNGKGRSDERATNDIQDTHDERSTSDVRMSDETGNER